MHALFVFSFGGFVGDCKIRRRRIQRITDKSFPEEIKHTNKGLFDYRF